MGEQVDTLHRVLRLVKDLAHLRIKALIVRPASDVAPQVEKQDDRPKREAPRKK